MRRRLRYRLPLRGPDRDLRVLGLLHIFRHSVLPVLFGSRGRQGAPGGRSTRGIGALTPPVARPQKRDTLRGLWQRFYLFSYLLGEYRVEGLGHVSVLSA